MSSYVELRVRSFYSFGEGASHLHDLLARAAGLGYAALALTDTNLCGALEFARLAHNLGVRPITGGQITLTDGSRLTFLAKNREGYSNLSRMFTTANSVDRRNPLLDPRLVPAHAGGLVLITGCADSAVSRLVTRGHTGDAEALLREYADAFGPRSVYIGLQQNRVYGDTSRNRKLIEIADRLNISLLATNDVYYHVPERHKLQNILTAVRNNCTLNECIDLLKPNENFYLRSPEHMARIFKERPDALRNTLTVAEMCEFDLSKDLGYGLPEPAVPPGYTPETYLRLLCNEAAQRRYGTVPEKVHNRLNDEFYLFRKHKLFGFLLLYREISQIAHRIMIEKGLTPPETPMENRPPGRGRGSSVALLTGYLIGISHVDPTAFDLTLERFLPEDMTSLPDIDLDFPRQLRETLIERIHKEFGQERAVLVGAISTYRIKGVIADVGKALGLPSEALRRLANSIHTGDLRAEMLQMADFAQKVDSPGWRDLIEVAPQLLQAPKALGQHVGGMILSSSPIPEMVPVRRSAIEGRFIMDWNKDSVDDAGFAKIDVLSLPVLDQMDETLTLVEQRTGKRPDLSRAGSDDPELYDMINQGKTIGVFLIQSPAQIKTSIRFKARNLKDMAYQVALIRPGVGVQGSAVSTFITRYRRPEIKWEYDHPLQARALERGCGIIVWQEQVVQVIADVGGMTTSEADQVRRAFAKPNNAHLLEMYKKRFMAGAALKGVHPEAAEKTWGMVNGHYMFPESHSYAFAINALQAAWLKAHYPLEFFTTLMNNLPMGFYPREVIKQDARRFGVQYLNPDINASEVECRPLENGMLMGLRFVKDIREATARRIVDERRQNGRFDSIGRFVQRLSLKPSAMRSLVFAGAFDSLSRNRKTALWEAALYDGPSASQLRLPLNMDMNVPALPDFSPYEKALGEYIVLEIYPQGHLMEFLRPRLRNVWTTQQVENARDGQYASVAGMVVARQHPRGAEWTTFITIEDEHFYTQLIVRPEVFQVYRNTLRSPVIKASGRISRSDDGNVNMIVAHMEPVDVPSRLPKSHDWH
ncbi:MAG: DNA polymerase III subunit alpha [SAR202 cluster bacterium]|nr:DNA polymerase III subunit alpha [SAR202 cluster bacterium]